VITLPKDHIFTRTRTGKKVHIATWPTTSVVRCGHWLKFSARCYQIDASRVQEAHICERCLELITKGEEVSL
jgi:hypothetical protein